MSSENDHRHPVLFDKFQKCAFAQCPNLATPKKEPLIPCPQCFGCTLYCNQECMVNDRVDHSLNCRRAAQRQNNTLMDTGQPLIERRVMQRNMTREYGGPRLMGTILNDLSAEEKATNVVFVPLDYDDKVLLSPRSPLKLVLKQDVARAMMGSDVLMQAYRWYIKHMRDRFSERFVYVCIYSPDMAFAEMIALPDNSSKIEDKPETGDKLEHTFCQCQCVFHRPKGAD